MAELVVVGPEETNRKRRPLPEGVLLRLGRAHQNDLAVPWDPLISREHAEVVYSDGRLHVRRLDRARNPIYYGEQDLQDFALADGEEFRIGNTQFRLVGVEFLPDPPAQVEERRFAPQQLQSFAFRKADHWLEMLSILPETIEQSRTDSEFAQRLVRILLDAIPRAEAAAVVVYEGAPVNTGGGADPGSPRIMQWDTRATDITGFRPSRTLIFTSLARRESVLHVWNAEEAQQKYTYSGRFDWAFCVPITEPACRGWCLYVSGSFGEDSGVRALTGDDLKEELRFTELLAQFIGAIRQVRMLEHLQAGMGQFFSPAIRAMLAGGGPESSLEPRECDITVLFCDVRGELSRRGLAEPANLQGLLDRVGGAMRTMTHNIFDQDGVVADFQGDAALGFWGWPLAAEDGPLRACRAALAIARMFREREETQGSSAVAIGIAHGPAIAGRIGTEDQAKLGVFGPVVNLGARLQGMTRQLRASILIDETTAEYVRRYMPASEGRCRRLGRIRPYGMDEVVEVSQLLPPLTEDASISDQDIVDFEAAVDAVAEGRWQDALALLDQLPIADRTKDFLMLFIALNGYEPPADWDGIFALQKK